MPIADPFGQQQALAQRYALMRLEQLRRAGLLGNRMFNAQSAPGLWRALSAQLGPQLAQQAGMAGYQNWGKWLGAGAPAMQMQQMRPPPRRRQPQILDPYWRFLP